MTSSKANSETLSLWVQCVCTSLVALGAAYASYRHGRDFALRFGADESTAAIWPLIVDGLLTTATVELWKPSDGRRWIAWTAFGFGISLSLCANIGSAPRLTVFSIVVAACPPLALLLAVELLNRALKRHRRSGRRPDEGPHDRGQNELADRPRSSTGFVEADSELAALCEESAEERMWAYYLEEQSAGRTPTGADLDRVAGTNNYGRRVLRQWRTSGRGPDGSAVSALMAGRRPPAIAKETAEEGRAELQPAI
ncbi:DUF2637 domain-containing protein [Amycolatopsis balhimycina DSM 5908]|uniref:DUF2637 domain-containing protein n=1 Tax=Amycolatopsis balhimycina DSM 5908 TaxID=1081091 RepID=A0A428W4C4_AMYBA|nr:DUF2637 domain-containing protein [Amycolatopsis balhimycina]RSM37951.1 DUF2637 domain-containing protein [Amycolatopsis balhimycina DSM 5908]